MVKFRDITQPRLDNATVRGAPYFGDGRHEKAMANFVRKVMRYFDQRGFNAWFGRTRCAFVHPNRKIVYKIPLNLEGVRANIREAQMYRNYKNVEKIRGEDPNASWRDSEVRIAKCRFFYVGDTGIPILAMEYVEPISISDNTLPKWADWIDCQQVGRNQKGEIVAYDV